MRLREMPKHKLNAASANNEPSPPESDLIFSNNEDFKELNASLLGGDMANASSSFPKGGGTPLPQAFDAWDNVHKALPAVNTFDSDLKAAECILGGEFNESTCDFTHSALSVSILICTSFGIAHEILERSSPTPVRWQFSWEDALDQTEPSDDNDEIKREFLDPLRMYQLSRLGSSSSNTPRSLLFGWNSLPESSRSQHNKQGSHVPPWSYPEDNISLTTDGSTYHHLQSRNLSSTQPSASNSLIAENTVKPRCRTAHADLMDHLFSDVALPPPPAPISRCSSSPEYARGHPLPLPHLKPVYPSLPPLYSPSPPEFHCSIADVLDTADHETEAQEHRSRGRAWSFPSSFGEPIMASPITAFRISLRISGH
ncbi:hypothetical protein BT96DRAFT_1005610 [Gymnopus androsaceus JB14]|uniref:Uncharacterized protein n=1 Tax=Gymnopus androsaceus JB14 TaxID=1447944 RepID=A0A6A4GMB4_9AGAR|nr:hypothetical protein BT96DRAFT_1005610 [Gymnopus androsaceus JB14]